MESVELEWVKIHSLNELSEASQKRGIYIYGFKINGRFIPDYVGKARNIRNRLVAHLNAFLGGIT